MIIASLKDVNALIETRKNKHNPLLLIRLPEVSSEDCRRWERILNEAFQECGCAIGSRWGFVAFLGTIGWGCYEAAVARFLWRPFLLQLLAVVVLGILVGKLVGLTRARMRIVATVRELQERLTPSEKNITDE
jgi:hypothetical protein